MLVGSLWQKSGFERARLVGRGFSPDCRKWPTIAAALATEGGFVFPAGFPTTEGALSLPRFSAARVGLAHTQPNPGG